MLARGDEGARVQPVIYDLSTSLELARSMRDLAVAYT